MLASLCASAAQFPDTPAGYYNHTRPYGTAGFLFFAYLEEVSVHNAVENRQAVINKVQAVIGADDGRVDAFIRYAREAVKTLQAEAPQRFRVFCARRAELDTALRLAVAMSEADAALERRRSELVRGAESVLGREAMLKFEAYLNSKSIDTSRAPEKDWSARLSELKQSPQEVLARICGAK
jgi:hypothetical protein